jgi:hypothetical protein
MEHLTGMGFHGGMHTTSTITQTTSPATERHADHGSDGTDGPRPAADPTLGPLVAKRVRRRSFAVMATTSAQGHPHAAGVLYQVAGADLWISTLRPSRKAANVAATGKVALTIPVRRLPFGPPSSIQVQAPARVVGLDDPELRRLAADGRLKKVTGHAELDLPDGCFLRVALPRRVPTYGIGMSLLAFLRNPLAAGRTAAVTWA